MMYLYVKFKVAVLQINFSTDNAGFEIKCMLRLEVVHQIMARNGNEIFTFASNLWLVKSMIKIIFSTENASSIDIEQYGTESN